MAGDDTPATREAFYSALLRSTLLVPLGDDDEATPTSEGAAAGSLAPDEAHTLRLFTTPPAEDGTWKVLVFTDHGALTAWRSAGVPTALLAAHDLFEMVLASPATGIVLNPAGPSGGELTHREISALAEGQIPTGSEEDAGLQQIELEPGSAVLVSAPERPPGEAFVGVLRMALEEAAAVRAAWLADVAFGGGEQHPALGIDLVPGIDDEGLRGVLEGVMVRIQPLLGHGRYLDVIVADGTWRPLFEDAGPPIFERGRG